MNNEKQKLFDELIAEFEIAGANPSEIKNYSKIAEIILSESKLKIPQNLINKIKSKTIKPKKIFNLPRFLLRTAAVFLFFFFAGLFILQELSTIDQVTDIIPVADENFEKIIIISAEQLTGENLDELTEKNYSVESSASKFTLTSSMILAFPYTKISHTDDYITLNQGEFVVNTGKQKLQVRALEIKTELANDTVAHFNISDDKNEVQFTVLAGQAVVILADNRVQKFDAKTEKKVMFFNKNLSSPLIITKSQDVEEKLNIVKICTNKIAEAFKTERILAVTPVQPKNFTIEHLVQNSNTNTLTLVKRIEIGGNTDKPNIIKINFQGKEQIFSLAKGDVISGWTLSNLNANGLTFTKDSEDHFVPYSK